jgi:hypothetical protein
VTNSYSRTTEHLAVLSNQRLSVSVANKQKNSRRWTSLRQQPPRHVKETYKQKRPGRWPVGNRNGSQPLTGLGRDGHGAVRGASVGLVQTLVRARQIARGRAWGRGRKPHRRVVSRQLLRRGHTPTGHRRRAVKFHSSLSLVFAFACPPDADGIEGGCLPSRLITPSLRLLLRFASPLERWMDHCMVLLLRNCISQ